MAKDTVEILIEGGSATPGPPLGPALGPFGINMMQVVEEINNKYFGIITSVPPMYDPQPMVSNTGSAPATPPVQNVNVSNTSETINTSSANNVNVTSQPDVNNVQENAVSEDPRGVRPPCFGNNEYNEKCAQCPWDAECV